MISPPVRCVTIAILLLACTSLTARAQVDSAKAEKTKKAAIEWLDRFARYQVLFHADDVNKLRERVAAMSPAEASDWWEKTEPQRKVLGSEEWRETEDWLRKFLAVQARYSDEEIRYFQSEAATKAKVSAGSLQEALDRVVAVRRKLVGGAKASQEIRKLELEANAAYRQEQAKLREEAVRQARERTPPAPVPTPAVRKPLPRDNGPLVDSLDVARWAILNELFPHW